MAQFETSAGIEGITGKLNKRQSLTSRQKHFHYPDGRIFGCGPKEVYEQQNRDFKRYFDAPDDASWDSPQGFGLEKLKTCPTGFPRDYEHMKYLRLKNYCAWHQVGDDFFGQEKWLDQMERVFRAAKPMMDFMNAVIDDYE